MSLFINVSETSLFRSNVGRQNNANDELTGMELKVKYLARLNDLEWVPRRGIYFQQAHKDHIEYSTECLCLTQYST